MAERTCATRDCERIHYARSLCKYHYSRLPDQVEQAREYERRRRSETARLQAERKRNSQRRSYLNAWYRSQGYGGIVEAVTRDAVLQRDGYRCQLCGRKTKGSWPAPASPTLDHIVPLAKGGNHTAENLQCACFACNVRKGARSANDQLRLAV